MDYKFTRYDAMDKPVGFRYFSVPNHVPDFLADKHAMEQAMKDAIASGNKVIAYRLPEETFVYRYPEDNGIKQKRLL